MPEDKAGSFVGQVLQDSPHLQDAQRLGAALPALDTDPILTFIMHHRSLFIQPQKAPGELAGPVFIAKRAARCGRPFETLFFQIYAFVVFTTNP